MKKILFVIFVYMFTAANVFSADKFELLYEKSIVLLIVPKDEVRQENRIRLSDGSSYVFDILGRDDLKARLNNLILQNQSEKYVTEIRVGSVVGFIANEWGHLPDPAVVQPVFKIVSADFLLETGGGIIR
jgi:hypothetical protein